MNVRQSILAITAVFGASLAQSAFAQDAAPAPGAAPAAPARRQRMNRPGQQPGGNPFGQMVMALSRLNLTAEQQAKYKELTDKFTAEVQAMLTPEQKAELMRQMAQAPGGGQGAGAPNLMDTLEPLNLTSDQKTQIQPLVDEAMKQMQALRQNAQPGANRREQMQAMMQITNDLKAKIRPLLTPEQQTKFDTLQFGGRGGRGGRGGQPGGAGAGAPPPAGANF